jgi:uncharacterized membrane protein YphA (DoxX/SURF4 family)
VNVVLWIITVLLAVAFLAAGIMKLTRHKEQLAESGLAWTEDFSPSAVRTIGLLEVLAAVGLVLPGVLGIAPWLVPLAALGLVLVMAGATATHARRHEAPMIVTTVVLLLVAAIVAWGRFGPYPIAS